MQLRAILWHMAFTAVVVCAAAAQAAEPVRAGEGGGPPAQLEAVETEAPAEPPLYFRSYDVRDLVGVDGVRPLVPSDEDIRGGEEDALFTFPPEVEAAFDALISEIQRSCGDEAWVDFSRQAGSGDLRGRPWVTPLHGLRGEAHIWVNATLGGHARVEEALRSLRAKRGYQVEIEPLALVFRVPHTREAHSLTGGWEYPRDRLNALMARILDVPEQRLEIGPGGLGLWGCLARPAPGQVAGEVPDAVLNEALWQYASGPAVIENGATWEIPGLNGALVKAFVLGEGQGIALQVAPSRFVAAMIDTLGEDADLEDGQALVVAWPTATGSLVTIPEWTGEDMLKDVVVEGRLPVLVVRAKVVKAPAAAPPQPLTPEELAALETMQIPQEASSDAGQRIEARLKTRVSLSLNETPLPTVSEFLQLMTNVTLLVVPSGVPADEAPVTMEFEGPVADALNRICRQTGNLWTVRHGAVLVGSKAALARNPRPTVLQFRLVADEAGPDTEDVAGQTEAGTVLHVFRKVELDDLDAASAAATLQQGTARWQVKVEWTPKGRETFARLSTQNVGKGLAIFVEGKLLLAPAIRTPVTEGVAIVGDFSQAEAERIARALAPPDTETLTCLKRRVSLSLTATPLSDVLPILEGMTGLSYTLAEGALPPEEASVTLTYDGTLEDALSLICIQSDMTWRPRGSVVELSPP